VIVPKEKGPQWTMNRIERGGRMQGHKRFFSCPSWLDWAIVANKAKVWSMDAIFQIRLFTLAYFQFDFL
jgi:hypothetical protein